MMDTIDIFFIYAPADKLLRDKLEKHLSMLKRQGFIRSWHDQKVLPGQEWKKEATLHLHTAHIILLLVSPDFLAWDYSYEFEFKHFLDRHQHGEAVVIPVILKPVDWKHDSLDKLQALPFGEKPVTSWPNQDEGLLSVAEGIREVVEELRKTPKSSLAKKGQDLCEQISHKTPDEVLADQDEKGIQQPQQISTLANTHQVPQSKYSIQIDHGEGTVIGDQVQVTQAFHEK